MRSAGLWLFVALLWDAMPGMSARQCADDTNPHKTPQRGTGQAPRRLAQAQPPFNAFGVFVALFKKHSFCRVSKVSA